MDGDNSGTALAENPWWVLSKGCDWKEPSNCLRTIYLYTKDVSGWALRSWKSSGLVGSRVLWILDGTGARKAKKTKKIVCQTTAWPSQARTWLGNDPLQPWWSRESSSHYSTLWSHGHDSSTRLRFLSP